MPPGNFEILHALGLLRLFLVVTQEAQGKLPLLPPPSHPPPLSGTASPNHFTSNSSCFVPRVHSLPL